MYEKLIAFALTQSIPLGTYTEKHHIIPRHCGGTDEPTNLVALTYRQHILAHLLLYRKHHRIEDLTAYRLMRGLPEDRKSAVCKMIGARHVQSGHIQALGRHNAESGWINAIKTKESLIKGGKAAGAKAVASGQVFTIRTTESSSKGGKTQGARAKESGQIQALGKYSGKYVMIAPNGVEYQHAFQMACALQLPTDTCIARCRAGSGGFSRRPKTELELAQRWSDVQQVAVPNFVADKLVHTTRNSKYIFIDANGIEYTTIQDIAAAHQLTPSAARKRCLHNIFNFSYKLKST